MTSVMVLNRDAAVRTKDAGVVAGKFRQGRAVRGQGDPRIAGHSLERQAVVLVTFGMMMHPTAQVGTVTVLAPEARVTELTWKLLAALAAMVKGPMLMYEAAATPVS